MFNIIRELALRHHQIHLVSSLIEPVLSSYVGVLSGFCASLHFVPRPQSVYLKAIWMLCSLLRRKPFVIFKHTSRFLPKIVEDVAGKVRPDVVLVEFHYISECIGKLRLPSVVDMHNIDYVLYERFAQAPRWGIKKIHGMLQSPLMYNFEKGIPHRFQACITVSDKDASLLRQISGATNIWVVPNGTDVEYFKPDCQVSSQWDLIYVGSMDYYPNVDAVLFLAEEILPKIWETHPDVSLVIVGRNPTPAVKSLAKDARITVTGAVDDVRYYWNRASIAILPLRVGSGTRLKALEAASMGKAIVGTPVGLEGIAFEHNYNAIIAENATDFAQSVLDLLENPDKRKLLGERARSLVVQHYSWSKCVQVLEEILENVTRGSYDSCGY